MNKGLCSSGIDFSHGRSTFQVLTLIIGAPCIIYVGTFYIWRSTGIAKNVRNEFLKVLCLEEKIYFRCDGQECKKLDHLKKDLRFQNPYHWLSRIKLQLAYEIFMKIQMKILSLNIIQNEANDIMTIMMAINADMNIIGIAIDSLSKMLKKVWNISAVTINYQRTSGSTNFWKMSYLTMTIYRC